ncbi:hypothetical protein HN51_063276 [Arachis hypogaea]
MHDHGGSEVFVFIYLFLMNLLSSRNGFQRPDKIKDSHRQSSQLEDLTQKMRECKRRHELSIRFYIHISQDQGAKLICGIEKNGSKY